MDFDEWMKRGKYLPEPLRDFHDQKRIFQIVGEMVTRRQQRQNTSYDRCLDDLPSWIIAHIYVIDFFLWFMARRGYTLQRSRQPYPFMSLDDDITAFEDRKMAAFKTMMEQSAAPERGRE